MSGRPKHEYTREEYLAFENHSQERHEYFDGDIFAMVGGSTAHGRIATNVTAKLHLQLEERDCEVFSETMRVRAPLANVDVYPDVVIVCGELELESDSPATLLNPMVVIEVLSRSIEKADRGAKFRAYRTIPSLQTYVLISQKAPRIEIHIRKDDTWDKQIVEGLDAVLDLAAIQCTLPLAQVYKRVTFDVAENDGL